MAGGNHIRPFTAKHGSSADSVFLLSEYQSYGNLLRFIRGVLPPKKRLCLGHSLPATKRAQDRYAREGSDERQYHLDGNLRRAVAALG